MPELIEQQTAGLQLLALDQAAEELFSMMMNVACTPIEQCVIEDGETLTAVVGLAGVLTGTFILRMREAAALRLAELLTGMEMVEIDSTVKDALGEVCNMLAGGWKSKTPELAAACMLSVPTIVSGSSYHIYSHQAPLHLERFFGFEKQCFCVAVLCDTALGLAI